MKSSENPQPPVADHGAALQASRLDLERKIWRAAATTLDLQAFGEHLLGLPGPVIGAVALEIGAVKIGEADPIRHAAVGTGDVLLHCAREHERRAVTGDREKRPDRSPQKCGGVVRN